MPYIGASVDESTKKKWESYLEDSDYGSMSELVRGVVRKEVRSDGQQSGQSDASREQAIEVDRLQEQQKATIDMIEELEESIEEAREERETTEYPEEVVNAAHQLAGDLQKLSTPEFEDKVMDVNTERAQLAAEYFGDSEESHKVAAAFNYLEENISWIRRKPPAMSDYYRVED